MTVKNCEVGPSTPFQLIIRVSGISNIAGTSYGSEFSKTVTSYRLEITVANSPISLLNIKSVKAMNVPVTKPRMKGRLRPHFKLHRSLHVPIISPRSKPKVGLQNQM